MIGIDDFNPDLVFDHIENITGEWYPNPAAPDSSFGLNSMLDVGKSASFAIYFNTTKVGAFVNNVFDWSFLKSASDSITVLPNITKTVNKEDIM